MSGIDFTDQVADQITLDPEPQTQEEHEWREAQRRSAALTLCDRATDAGDARSLLEMLGLASYERGRFATYQFGRPRSAPAVGDAAGPQPGGRAVSHGYRNGRTPRRRRG